MKWGRGGDADGVLFLIGKALLSILEIISKMSNSVFLFNSKGELRHRTD
jgi:hypothetical protein